MRYVRKIVIALVGLFLLAVVIFGVMLIWPMYDPDPNQTIELIPADQLPQISPNSSFTARDGQELPLRFYPADESKISLILIHGGGGYGVYLHEIASFLSADSVARVYVPDMRGHGEHSVHRGDIDYTDQLVDDVADLIEFVREKNSQAKIVVGGHSAGGGLALRLTGEEQANNIDGYLLLAPLLGIDAPTSREDGGGYVHLRLSRIMALSILNSAGITALDGLETVYFNRPEPYQTDHHTLIWSWRLAKGFGPRNYASDLSAINVPFLLVVGENDDVFLASEYEPIINEYAPHGEVIVKPGLNHVGDILRNDRALEMYASWLMDL